MPSDSSSTAPAPHDGERPCLHHALKVWPQFIPALADGSKTFEARKDDRSYRVGDVLDLYGWDPGTHMETGWKQSRTVTYKLSGPAWGVESGYCILGLSPLSAPTAAGGDDIKRYDLACLLHDLIDGTKRKECRNEGGMVLMREGLRKCLSLIRNDEALAGRHGEGEVPRDVGIGVAIGVEQGRKERDALLAQVEQLTKDNGSLRFLAETLANYADALKAGAKT
jgi:hypothetical protein